MTMIFHTKLLGMAVFAGLLVAMGSQGQAAPANGQCAKLYRGVYTHSALHKAFATLDGARPSPRTVCGYGDGFKLKSQAVAEGLARMHDQAEEVRAFEALPYYRNQIVLLFRAL